MLSFFTTQSARHIKHAITWLLKSWLCNEIKKIPYAKSYTVVEGKVQKQQGYLLLLTCEEKNHAKIQAFLDKNLPGAQFFSFWV